MIKHLANKAGFLVVARKSSERKPKISKEDFLLVSSLNDGCSPLENVFHHHKDFSLKIFHSYNHDHLTESIDHIFALLKTGLSFVDIRLRNDVVQLFAAKDLKMNDVDSLIAAINRNPKLVEDLNDLLEELENDN